jgi:sulfoxide reductase heme-binding subunit YedZ
MVAIWLKDHFEAVWRLLFLACSVPAVWLLYCYNRETLGPNPLSFLLHTTGRSALVLLTATLTITPLRRLLTQLSKIAHLRYGKRLSDWNWLIRLRRLLGLWCFAYALAHAWIYAAFDLGYDWTTAWFEVQEKPYLLAGAMALAMLFPLAATSTQSMMRRLGKNWRRLHTLTYAVAIAGLLHFWWMMKPGLWTPWPDTVILVALLGYRLALRTGWLERWDGFNGMDSQERVSENKLMKSSNPRLGEGT